MKLLNEVSWIVTNYFQFSIILFALNAILHQFPPNSFDPSIVDVLHILLYGSLAYVFFGPFKNYNNQVPKIIKTAKKSKIRSIGYVILTIILFILIGYVSHASITIFIHEFIFYASESELQETAKFWINVFDYAFLIPLSVWYWVNFRIILPKLLHEKLQNDKEVFLYRVIQICLRHKIWSILILLMIFDVYLALH